LENKACETLLYKIYKILLNISMCQFALLLVIFYKLLQFSYGLNSLWSLQILEKSSRFLRKDSR